MISKDVQELVNKFDLEYESKLNFNQIMDNNKNLIDYIDELINKSCCWDFIAVTCRRMIICDRMMDLELGSKIFENAHLEFQKLNPEEEPYEAIKYMNACGLIHYRSGNYSKALEFFENANKMANDLKNMKCFIPDTKSNIIRTKFEFFSQSMPDEINESLATKYKAILKDFVESYEKVIKKYEPYDLKNKNFPLIYGHGMASLHHNLAETYSKVSTKKGFNLLFNS